MTELLIENGIIIDDAESVLYGIREISGRQVSDLDVVKKFINTEKNTKFYLDSSLNSFMERNSNSVYIWLDTGYTDRKGNPIMTSLLNSFCGFVGHVVGTIKGLAESAKNFFKLKRNIVDQRMAAFQKKYASKAGERDFAHIIDEKSYLMNRCNMDDTITDFAAKVMTIGLQFDPVPEEEIVEEDTLMEEDTFSEEEEEITIELLLKKMESMQNYMDELLEMLEDVNQKSQTTIRELQEKNDEYRRVIIQMRSFVDQEESSCSHKNRSERPGHDLLGAHGKILVIGGTELGVNVMQGIAKTYGFEKQDFDFIDYDEIKTFADRIRRGGRYQAVIIGACPHKTTATSGYSSTVKMLKQTEGMPYTADARSKSGTLKVTKESFREALMGVCTNLRMACTC